MKPVIVEIEGKSYIEMSDDKRPIYLMDDGSKTPVDPASMHSKILELNKEGATRRSKIDDLESKLSKFDGIESVDDALKALETVKNLDDKKLVDAGEVEAVKAAAIKAIEDKYAPTVEENSALKADLRKAIIGGAFSRSSYLTEKTTMTPAIAEAVFSGNFSLGEGNKIIAKDGNGNEIYSPSNAGNPATFDEALSILVNNHPDKKSLMKGVNQDGGGSTGGGNDDGSATIKRSDFEKLDSGQKREVLKTKKLVD